MPQNHLIASNLPDKIGAGAFAVVAYTLLGFGSAFEINAATSVAIVASTA
jgi:hypothetical protein